MNLSTQQLTILSLGCLVLALLAIASLLIWHELRRARNARVIGNAIQRGRNADPLDANSGALDGTQPARDSDLPAHWLNTPFGRALVADEDRRLIDQCGLPSIRTQLVFLVTRTVLAVGLPLVVWLLGKLDLIAPPGPMALAIAFVLGFMLPKWVLGRWAAARRAQVVQELPLFVDLLRLLQGVGLSLDQSLQVMADDFGHVLKVLGAELLIANRQYSQGRTREHSLQRLGTLHDNEGLAGLVALLVQVDRHGGAVQEPLRQFSDRLRESRRADLKARIGKITVKMTGVMVATLLPALLIVAAGPGFIGIVRSLEAIAK